MSQLSEKELIQACVKADGKAQKVLYDKYSKLMFGICLRYCGNYDEAKDVLQDGFIKVFTKMHQFGFQGSFEGWLKKIFVNTALEHQRGLKITKYHLGTEQAEHLPINEDILGKISQKEIVNILQQMAPGYRNVLNLYIIEGYSHAEIAEMLNINEGTSKSQLSRARSILQKAILEKENFNKTQ